MQYIQKQKIIDAIIYNGTNLDEVKNLLKDKFRYGKIMDDGHLFLMLNENNACYCASINDYIAVDEIHGFTMTKEVFENNYIPRS